MKGALPLLLLICLSSAAYADFGGYFDYIPGISVSIFGHESSQTIDFTINSNAVISTNYDPVAGFTKHVNAAWFSGEILYSSGIASQMNLRQYFPTPELYTLTATEPLPGEFHATLLLYGHTFTIIFDTNNAIMSVSSVTWPQTLTVPIDDDDFGAVINGPLLYEVSLTQNNDLLVTVYEKFDFAANGLLPAWTVQLFPI